MSGYKATFLGGGTGRELVGIPELPDEVIPLPLRAGGQAFGVLALYRSLERPLGKDQVQALFASVNHLALALRNAALFNQVKSRADHDGLTRIHNRRAFDERLVDELRRHQRYRQPMVRPHRPSISLRNPGKTLCPSRPCRLAPACATRTRRPWPAMPALKRPP